MGSLFCLCLTFVYFNQTHFILEVGIDCYITGLNYLNIWYFILWSLMMWKLPKFYLFQTKANICLAMEFENFFFGILNIKSNIFRCFFKKQLLPKKNASVQKKSNKFFFFHFNIISKISIFFSDYPMYFQDSEQEKKLINVV